MKFSLKVVLAFLVIGSFMGCKKSSKGDLSKPVVQVNDKILTMGELCEAVPNTLSKDDSILFANDFINRWVKSKLLLQRAELNLTPDEKDVTDLLDEYRSSLLIYKYQAKMVEQKYSSTVSDADIEVYYKSMPDNFKLWEPIIKGVFIKVSRSMPNVQLIENRYRSARSADLTDLEGFCFQNAKKYLIFPDEWKTVSSVLENFPAVIPNVDQVLENDRFYITSDNEYRYFLAVHDIKLSGELAPLESVKDRIRAILVNKKRLDFIKKMENDLFDDGVLTGAVKFLK